MYNLSSKFFVDASYVMPAGSVPYHGAPVDRL